MAKEDGKQIKQSWITESTGMMGRLFLKTADHFMTLSAFAVSMCGRLPGRRNLQKPSIRKGIIEQIHFSCIRILPLFIPVAFIIGVTLIIQFAKISGRYDLGKTVVLLIVRETGPFVTAFLMILSTATSVVIEISMMDIGKKQRHNPEDREKTMQLVCIPRFIGITASFFFLFFIFDLTAILGGYSAVWVFTDIQLGNFLSQVGKAIDLTDIFVNFFKALGFGLTISAVSLYYGLSGNIRPEKLSVLCTRTSLECFFYCLIINVFVSALFYL